MPPSVTISSPRKKAAAPQKKVTYKDNLIDKFASQRPRGMPAELVEATPLNETKAVSNVKNSQLSAEPTAYHAQPLFELPPQGRQPQHSGACAGCGETPYLKCITQFFGEQMIVIKRFF